MSECRRTGSFRGVKHGAPAREGTGSGGIQKLERVMRGPADESQSQAVPGARPVESRASAGQGGEPIAVVGMACQFPRAPSVVDFWRLLEAGESGVIEGVPGSGVGRIGELFPDR